jgi:hypothetical protein
MPGTVRVLCLVLAAVTTSAAGHGDPCGNAPSELGLAFGHDASGYWIRTDLIPGALPPSVATRWVKPPGEFLASEAAATVLFVAGRTTTVLGPGEWREESPLGTLKAFCTAGGLEVDTAVPRLWVVMRRGDPTRAAVTVFAQPVDPEHQKLQPEREVEGLERALVNRLSELYLYGGDQSVGVSYYWLPKEGPDILLVVASSLREGVFAPLQTRVFKVRFERSGGNVKLECLWASDQAWGALMPEVDEDFDGDGYRDFLFDPGNDEHHEAVILSGRTGTKLLELRSGLLAVEKDVAGAERLAARTKEGGLWAPRVLLYEKADQTFVEDKEHGPTANALSVGAGDSPRTRLLDTFASAVGGRAKVKLYAAPGWRPELTAVDRGDDRITFVDWRPEPIGRIYYVTPKEVEKGRPSHILYRWESQAFQEERKRKLQQQQKEGGAN